MTTERLDCTDDSIALTMNSAEGIADNKISVSAQHNDIAPSINDQTYRGLYHGLLPDAVPNLSSEAAQATQDEHRMPLLSAFQLYPKAIGWSAAISLAIIMEGYDTALINGFYAFPEFLHKYGDLQKNGTYEMSTTWQTAFSNASSSGSIIGLFMNGIVTQKLGYRRTMMTALAFLAAFISLSFFATNRRLLLSGQVLCGVSWGVFSTLTTTYAAEILPTSLRGYLTAAVNLCWLLGQIVAFGALRGLIDLKSQWSYKIPFGVQWIWILIVFVLTYFAPESPWWLIQHGRPDDARKTLIRLTRSDPDYNADYNVELMQHTNDAEKTLNEGRSISFWDCFRGPNLRRTEIACVLFMIQNMSGLPMISFAAYFYSKIGFDKKKSFDLTIGMQGVAILANLLSFGLQTFYGRRKLYLLGLIAQLLILLTAGAIGTLAETPGHLWAIAGLIIAFIFIFDLSVAPLTYCLVAEVPSTRLRVKTVVLARIAYNINTLITNVLQNHMLNSDSWNWRGKSCFFWAGSCLLCIAYCYFRLPETKGLTYLELDLLFEKRAPARKFKIFREKLADTGYFSIYEGERERPSWVERRSGSGVKNLFGMESKSRSASFSA